MSITFDARRAARDALALAAIAGAILMGLSATLAASSPASDAVAAIFPPWWDAPRAFEAAASVGDIAGVGRWRTIVILRGDSHALAPRLRAAGALIVVAAGSFAGCAQAIGRKGK